MFGSSYSSDVTSDGATSRPLEGGNEPSVSAPSELIAVADADDHQTGACIVGASKPEPLNSHAQDGRTFFPDFEDYSDFAIDAEPRPLELGFVSNPPMKSGDTAAVLVPTQVVPFDAHSYFGRPSGPTDSDSDITTPKRGRGRPIKPASEYVGAGGEALQRKNAKRRAAWSARGERHDRRRSQKTLPGALPEKIGNNLGGRPPNPHTPPEKLEKDRLYRAGRAEAARFAVALGNLKDQFCKPEETVQDVLERIAPFGGRDMPKQHLPTLANQTTVARNAADIIKEKRRMEHKKALLSNLYKGVTPQNVATLTGIKLRTASSTEYQDPDPKTEPTVFTAKYKAGAVIDRSSTMEKAAGLEHAKGLMSMKSGTAHPVWLLPIPLEAAYLAYRRDFASILQEMIDSAPGVFEPTGSAKSTPMHNIQLVMTQGCNVPVEPWKTHLGRIKTWTENRKAAGLETSINPRCIAFHGERMTFIDVEMSDDSDCSMEMLDESDDPVDSTSAPAPSEDSTTAPTAPARNRKLSRKVDRADQVDILLKWQAVINESRALRNHLRPRSYKTWRKWLDYDPDINWRAVSQPYNCDICDGAHLTRADYRILWKRHVALAVKKRTDQAEYLEVNAKLNKAASKVDALNRHMRQWKNQRPYVRVLEDNLPARTATEWHIIVFEDFVAQYNFRKKKVANLVFTVKWRDANGKLQYK